MRKALIILPLLCFFGCQQYGDINKVANLSRSLAEISGIEHFKNSELIYGIADHANPNEVYAIDSTGLIKQEIIVANATNEDWEDLASDGKNRLFIGDFGNNDNDRREQAIYTITNIVNLQKEVDTAYAKKTTFTLSDQEKYPAALKDRNYDIEAFIYRDESLYLFTRNRNRNFDGTTKVYKLPAREGAFEAKLITTYKICDDLEDCFITGATQSADGKDILLLTYDKVVKLSDFEKDDFFGGKIIEYDLNHTSKKEGICYKDENTVYLVDERRAQTGGNLYTFPLN
ncbi:MAG: hypothetical protein V7767_04125 [Leeuwenhoekiella sp.]